MLVLVHVRDQYLERDDMLRTPARSLERGHEVRGRDVELLADGLPWMVPSAACAVWPARWTVRPGPAHDRVRVTRSAVRASPG